MFYPINYTIEATIFDSRHEPVTILGGMGRIPQDVVLDYLRDTFNTEFGSGYSCEVSRVFDDGTREPLCDWAI